MAARGGGMNRKGKLTTKGKHAVILTLTIVACVAAMLFSLLLSVLCDGKHVSSLFLQVFLYNPEVPFPTENMYLLQRMHKMIHIRASWQEARGRRPTC